MRRLVVLEHISLDGVIQAPGGPEEDTSGGFAHGGWIAPFADATLGTLLRRQMNLPFDLLLGRRTYDIWAPYWPQHGDVWPRANAATKYVASNTLASGDWQPTVVLSGDVVAQVAHIKQQPGPDLHVWGSSNLLQTLLKHDLVNAFWLMIYPVTLGGGKRLFGEGAIPLAFQMTESVVTSKGVVVANYERTGAITTGT
ncbi:MAG: dihydrofolate reductase family protein [Anaerolineae bacterium]